MSRRIIDEAQDRLARAVEVLNDLDLARAMAMIEFRGALAQLKAASNLHLDADLDEASTRRRRAYSDVNKGVWEGCAA